MRRYISKMTGLSRAQATRLLGMYLRGEKVQPKQYRRRRFPQRYTREDAALLASVDEAHDTISGPATRKILQRARYDFKDAKYTRLAELSVAQLYRLRKSRAYRERLTTYQPTRPTKVSIGERRLGDTGIFGGFDVAPDGKRVLVPLPAAEDPKAHTLLRVLLNVDSELRRRVAIYHK